MAIAVSHEPILYRLLTEDTTQALGMEALQNPRQMIAEARTAALVAQLAAGALLTLAGLFLAYSAFLGTFVAFTFAVLANDFRLLTNQLVQEVIVKPEFCVWNREIQSHELSADRFSTFWMLKGGNGEAVNEVKKLLDPALDATYLFSRFKSTIYDSIDDAADRAGYDQPYCR